MLNAIGIQNPGVERWVADFSPLVPALAVPVWGSSVGSTAGEFGRVAARLDTAGVAAIEINLSCPNLAGEMFSLVPGLAAEVTAAVRASTLLPLGAKLSPNTIEIDAVADACLQAGADFLVLTNTVWGAGVDLWERRPTLHTAIGGYSGPPLKPIALRCVIEVHRSFPDATIVGCGGVATGADIVEYLLAGASAVEMGTVHFAEPKAGRRILRELTRLLQRIGAGSVRELIGELKLS
jgi:dihydroorotate dehydrogenase (NAD+) catalytic subunit